MGIAAYIDKIVWPFGLASPRYFRVNMRSSAPLRAAPGSTLTPTPRRQRACLARRAIPANGATVRSRLARRIFRPGMSIVPSEAGALRRPSARRPSRRSPRVVWWDSTGSSRSHGRSMRCVPVPRHEKLSRASRLQGSPPPRITYRSPSPTHAFSRLPPNSFLTR